MCSEFHVKGDCYKMCVGTI